MHGYGTFNYGDGKKYVGEWKNGNKHGNGTYVEVKKSKYMPYTYTVVCKYVGEYKNDKKDGNGTMT